MKKIYLKVVLLLFTVLVGEGVVAQVGVGTPTPNASTQLDVVATDKGILVPRVALTSSTDATTITNGNIVSLLVFNTATNADVTPGFHYWDGTKWARVAVTDDVAQFQTVTPLVDNGDGTYTYTDESGATTTINTVQNGAGDPNTGGVTGGAGDIYVDNSTGDIYTYDGTTWVIYGGAPETITMLVDNNDGTYSYTSEDGTVTIIDVVSDIYMYGDTLLSNGTFITNLGDILITNQQFLDSLVNIVQTNETVSTLVDNGDGTYTYTDESGTMTTIDNTQMGAGDPNTGGVPGTAGDIYVDNSTGDIYTYDGTTWVLQNGTPETITTMIDNGNGTITYTSEDGTQTTFAAQQGWTYVAQGPTINVGESMLVNTNQTVSFPATATQGQQLRIVDMTGGAGWSVGNPAVCHPNTFLSSQLSGGAMVYEFINGVWMCVSL